MTPVPVTNWSQKTQRLIQQEPRKAGVLGALLLVLGFMAVRLVMTQETTPSVAHASHEGLRLGSSSGPVTSGGRGTFGAGAGSSPVFAWLDMPTAPLTRNPFHIRYEIFPPEVTKSQTSAQGQGFWDEIAKSLMVQVDQEEKKQEVLLAVQSRASELQVASVMMGPTPRAIVNDKLVGEGDVVANFRVLKIEARRIFVESEGIRLEIQMK